MAPKKGKPKEEEPPPEAPPEEEEPCSTRKAWVYGINNHVERLDAEVVQAFRGKGHLREDYALLCRKLSLVGHHELMPMEKGLPAPKELTLQSCLLDRASILMLQVVLPSALHLSSLRLSGCALDVELLLLLRQALTSETAVQTLHVEWNRVELPMEEASRGAIKEAHHWSEIDEVERQLEQRRSQRYLLTFRDELEMLQGGSISEAVQQLAEKVVPGRSSSAVRWPMDLQTWTSIFYDTFHMDVHDCEPIFNILDSDHGAGDALVPLVKLQEVLENLPTQEVSTEERLLPPAQPPEFSDEIGSAFAAFLDKTSPLEMLSFRCCNLNRLEVQAISSALASPSPHLRALNLWGNKICDRSAKFLAEALEFNFGLQFLGLGRNFVTHVGLQSLCQVLGVTRITDKATFVPLPQMLHELPKRGFSVPPPPPPRPAPKAEAKAQGPSGASVPGAKSNTSQPNQGGQQKSQGPHRGHAAGFRFGAAKVPTLAGPEVEVRATLEAAKTSGGSDAGRQALKRLLLRWHPDKAPQGETPEAKAAQAEATRVLRFILQERERLGL